MIIVKIYIENCLDMLYPKMYKGFMDIKTLFKNTRRLLEMNQKDFAEKIGVSQASISRYERGLVQPSVKIWMSLQAITRGENEN